MTKRPFHRDTKSDVKILMYPDRTTSSAPDFAIESRTRDSCSIRLSNPESSSERGIDMLGTPWRFACAKPPASGLSLITMTVLCVQPTPCWCSSKDASPEPEPDISTTTSRGSSEVEARGATNPRPMVDGKRDPLRIVGKNSTFISPLRPAVPWNASSLSMK